MALLSTEIDQNVAEGRSDGEAWGETTSGTSAAAYLNADQRGGTAANGKPSLTIDEAAVQLTRDEASWGDYWGDAATVTFAFRSTAPAGMPEETAGFSRFSGTQINATLLALQAWSDVANITFNRVGSGTSGSTAYSNQATMLFGNYSSGQDGAAAFAYYPYSYAYSAVDGDVWVNSTESYNANPQMFNYGQMVLIHEIGHAIGISHPADYDAGDDEDITYSEHATYFEDSIQYTVMSYFYETYTGASYGSPYPATIMLDDIAAAQRLYGANMTTRTGDTVYGFNSNADRPWFATSSSSTPLIFVVWDAGGNDTFDFSGYASNARIELREGFFSNVGGLTGNVAVAQGVTIENAKGGHGADTIIGNAAANRLQGNAGADTLTGLGGADVFVFTSGGGADIVTDFVVGTDKLDATAFGSYLSIVQSGADAVVNFTSAVSVRLTNVSAANVTSSSFIGLAGEPPPPPPPPPPNGLTVTGGSGPDSLVGGSGDDFLYGLAGSDKLNGRAGADAMYGGTGNDTYVVDNAGDQVFEDAGEGIDGVLSTVSVTLAANVENLTLSGSAAIDGVGNALANKITGNAAANVLSGADGKDRIDGRAGADTMRGGAGDDTYTVDNAGDQVVENAAEGYDRVTSTVSFTLGANVEYVTLGGDGAIDATGNSLGNMLRGNGAANVLRGEAGNDTIYGFGGNDRIIGGEGHDKLTGGAGADVFVFTLGGAGDIVYDFQVGTDRLDVTAFGGYLSMVQKGADTLITFAAGVSTLLKGVSAATVTAASFIGAVSIPPAGPLTLYGTANTDILTGEDGDDTLYGYAGADVLDGGGGGDALYGGMGDDSYHVDSRGDRVIELAGEGYDTVHTSVSMAIPTAVEALVAAAGAAVTLTGSSGADTLIGNDLANTLRAGPNDDVLDGGGGDDVLQGSHGLDQLTGGAGADTFLYLAMTDSRADRPDLIADFDPLADVIDLSGIDANTSVAGDQAFAWVGALTGQAGQATLTYSAGADLTVLSLDANGDGVAEFKVEIAGHVTTDGGFIL